jgi:hypothetical protein
MAAEQPTASVQETPEEAQVRDYLERHPDFFQRHPDMLRALHIPHASGDAVSLVERQVSVLRERNVDLRHRLRDLTDAARDNEALYTNTRNLVLELLEADSLDSLFATFTRCMQSAFKTDYCAIIVYGEADDSQRGASRRMPRDTAAERIGALLRSGKPACGALRAEEFSFLFPSAGASGSAAVVPLVYRDETLGLVAVGSSDAKRYHTHMGTVFLEHIAAVIARLLQRTELAG